MGFCFFVFLGGVPVKGYYRGFFFRNEGFGFFWCVPVKGYYKGSSSGTRVLFFVWVGSCKRVLYGFFFRNEGFVFFGVPVKGQYKGSFKGSLTGYKGSSPGTRMFGFLGWDLGLWVCGLGFRYSLQTGVLGLWIRY